MQFSASCSCSRTEIFKWSRQRGQRWPNTFPANLIKLSSLNLINMLHQILIENLNQFSKMRVICGFSVKKSILCSRKSSTKEHLHIRFFSVVVALQSSSFLSAFYLQKKVRMEFAVHIKCTSFTSYMKHRPPEKYIKWNEFWQTIYDSLLSLKLANNNEPNKKYFRVRFALSAYNIVEWLIWNSNWKF